MKNRTKDNKGITLIALIITIIVMLILVSVTTFTGIDTYKESRVNHFVTQMQLLQAKVDDLVSTNSFEELQLDSVTTQEQINAITNAFKQNEIITGDTSKYKVFNKDKVLEILEVEDIENDIMVNFETREIVSSIGVEHNGKTYYTQYLLPAGQVVIPKTSETTRDLTFNLNVAVDGLNATVTISDILITNGTLSYREQGDSYWNTINNYIEKGKSYTIVVSKSAIYEFKLTDNATGESSNQTIEIIVTNKPKAQSTISSYNYSLDAKNWAYALDEDGNYYLWIPRFAYKINTDTNETQIKFIKGNSNIATDNTYINDEWKFHNKFKEKPELTGIWVSVTIEEMNQTEQNIITLLDDSTRKTLIEI